MRKLIAGMKISIDGMIEGPAGFADWVDGWSDDYGLTAQIDACVLGGGMYPGYEQYWTAIRKAPLDGVAPTPGEVEWSEFAARTPHYVLSGTLDDAEWPNTSFVRGTDGIAVLKQQLGKDIYLMGGARITESLIDAGLVDELRLIVYPLVAGDESKPLFRTARSRRKLELRQAERHPDDRVSLTYRIN